MNGNMEQVYYEPSHAGSFGGVKALIRYSGAPTRTVQGWLREQDAYTLHKPIRKKFLRRKTFSKGINDMFQSDLCDMIKLSRYNDNMKYILTCICVYSKFAWAVALPDKRGPTVASALEKIFAERTPNYLQTDEGTEYYNSQVAVVLKKYNIKHYSSLNRDVKCAVIERFNRTIKTRMYRYFTRFNTLRWVDVLPNLIESYNNTFHRSIQMAPSEVNAANEEIVGRRLYPVKPKPVWKFNLQDTVRISRLKQVFEKGYVQNWSDELFTVVERFPTFPVTYGIADMNGERIKGRFYSEELQKVTKTDDVYTVEKILKTRRRNGKVEYFVRWRGYPDSFNSWTSDVFRI